MKDDNQRIIFLVSEDTTPAQIILDILEKNGINDPADDLIEENKTPRLVIVNDATKDLFEKKITEEKLAELFQNKLKVSKEIALKIINDLKQELIPFGKKINIPSDNEATTVTISEKPPISFTEIIEKNTQTPKEEPISSITAPPKKSRPNRGSTTESGQAKIKKPIIEEIEKPVQQIEQPKGPDSYREPIE